MPDAIERLVNLAFFLAASRAPVTAREIREQVEGYTSDQDEEAFLRMFERDKKELRAAGLVIRTVESASAHAYELDRGATFQRPVTLSADDSAVLRAAGAALVDDPGFPFAGALATALAKLAASPVTAVFGRLADEDASLQAAHAAEFARAAVARKRVAFVYESADGRVSERDVEPYGLFLREGRWYMIGRDTAAGEPRVFAIRRVGALSTNVSRPGTPDFVVPDGFESADFARLPFQYGSTPFEAVLDFDADLAWRAPLLAEGRGRFEDLPDGTVRWSVEAADPARLARWVVENGPGVRLVAPDIALEALRKGLERVASEHG